MLVLALAQVALAQDQRPLPAGSPDLVVGRAVVVHVTASEDLEPDVLRALARPLVTLWLTTRSNTLRDSTLTTLSRFDSAFVQLRPPLAMVDGAALAAAPRAGLWLRPDPRWPQALERFRGSRPIALDLEGALDDEAARLARAIRPSRLRWKPSAAIDVMQWARFHQLAARRSMVVTPEALLARDCGDRLADEASAELHVATLLAMSAGVFPCGKGTRVEVPPEVERWLLTSLLARDPSIELSVTVGDDPRKVSAVRRLLETLGR